METVLIAVSGFGGRSDKETLQKRTAFTVAPVDKPGKPQCIEALTVPVICRPAEAVDIHPATWLHLQGIKFPEEFPAVNGRLMCSLAWISIIPL